MTATDIAAWVSALTGTGVLLWDIFSGSTVPQRGARIKVSAVKPDWIQSSAQFLGNQTCVAVEATNVGQSKTTITHLAESEGQTPDTIEDTPSPLI